MTPLESFKQSVSRETSEMLEAFSNLLMKWNRRINLIAPTEESNLWHRHIFDSAQVFQHAETTTKDWFDLGSGGGFPGIVCAILAKAEGRIAKFSLVESDQRKSIFLKQVVSELSLPAQVHNIRIERFGQGIADTLSARALAPLPKLLDLSSPHFDENTVLLLPKGKRVESELTAAQESWQMNIHRIQSLTDPDGVILKLTGVQRRT